MRASLASIGLRSALLPLLLAGCSRPTVPARTGPPDVYLIVVDTLRADHLGVYGDPDPTSPEIDALARGSLVFDQAHATAPWTLPSISTMLTGHHPAALGIAATGSVDASVSTLTDQYRDQGYATAAVVGHIFLLPKFGLVQGMMTVDSKEIRKNPHMHVSSPAVCRRALSIIDDHLGSAPEQPLFMLVHFFDPHYNYFDHPELYDPDPSYDGPVKSGMPYHELRDLVRAEVGGAATPRRISQLYDSEIRFTDASIGQLVAGLKARNRYDNAMVILVGDHGEELGDRPDHWVGHTRPMTEDVLHVPLIMKLPGGARAGQHVSAPVSLIDLMPTVATLTGLPVAAAPPLDGQPLDLDHPEHNRDTLFAQTERQVRNQMVLRGTWKLHRYLDRAHGTDELYDLATDPGEHTDVLAQQPALAAELGARLDAWDDAVEVDHALLDPKHGAPLLSPDEESALRAMGYLE